MSERSDKPDSPNAGDSGPALGLDYADPDVGREPPHLVREYRTQSTTALTLTFGVTATLIGCAWLIAKIDHAWWGVMIVMAFAGAALLGIVASYLFFAVLANRGRDVALPRVLPAALIAGILFAGTAISVWTFVPSRGYWSPPFTIWVPILVLPPILAEGVYRTARASATGYCRRCGGDLHGWVKQCGRCGKELTQSVADKPLGP